VWQAGGAFADDGPLAKRVAELDTNGDGSLQRDEVPFGEYFFKLADRDGDGAVSVAEASAFAPVARARKKVASNNADGIRKKFGQADTDGDGVVTREEFPAADELFQRFDRDGDGKVVFAEALAFAVEEQISKVFAEGDLDLSGTLTQDEMKDDDAKLVLSAADLDRDGQVTGKEAFDFVAVLGGLDPKARRYAGERPIALVDGGSPIRALLEA
jgi:Ca2+-binding EF-hand superfamily protein